MGKERKREEKKRKNKKRKRKRREKEEKREDKRIEKKRKVGMRKEKKDILTLRVQFLPLGKNREVWEAQTKSLTMITG